MNVLLIGYKESKIRDFLNSESNLSWIDGGEKITMDLVESYSPDYIVLHGCHSILGKDIVKKYPRRIINCHGAYLPFNRGAHPNVWSFIDNTPKGGTVHFIDENIDEGDIISRKTIEIQTNDTLSTTYWRIRDLLEDMFIDNWNDIIENKLITQKQDLTIGKTHYRKELESISNLLSKGWETPVKELEIWKK